jgi:hypothetical protein
MFFHQKSGSIPLDCSAGFVTRSPPCCAQDLALSRRITVAVHEEARLGGGGAAGVDSALWLLVQMTRWLDREDDEGRRGGDVSGAAVAYVTSEWS